VRAVDGAARCLYVTTPLADALLAHVNTLVLGALALATDVVAHAAKAVRPCRRGRMSCGSFLRVVDSVCRTR
jgi:hypothetical protein